MDNLRVGEPLDKCMDMGAIVNESQLERIKNYVELARKEGCSVHQSSNPIPESGLFYPPTLIYDIETSSKCVIDEIFGPVVVLMPFRNPQEAVALGNNTAYGLSCSIWTETLAKALDISFQIKAGVIWINSHNLFDAAAGFGGYKESGFGRESGKEGLYEYLKLKWQPTIRNQITEEQKNASWGDVTPPGPTLPGSCTQDDGVIDKTTKLFYGGRQARPDGDYSRVIISSKGVSIKIIIIIIFNFNNF